MLSINNMGWTYLFIDEEALRRQADLFETFLNKPSPTRLAPKNMDTQEATLLTSY